jgi:hypothetical protein
VLGWKYVEAAEDAQKYKVGKYILETRRVVKSLQWEPLDDEDGDVATGAKAAEQDIEFDSQDEDECEDLFSGIWSPGLAAKRRKNKAFGRHD